MKREDKLIRRYSEFKLAFLTVVLLFFIVFPLFLPSRITINQNIYFVVAVLIAWLASGIIYLVAHLLAKNINFRFLRFTTLITDILFLSALLYILGGINSNYFFVFAFVILGAAFYLDSGLVITTAILSIAVVTSAFLLESSFPLSFSSYLVFFSKIIFLVVVAYFVYLLVLSYLAIRKQKEKIKEYSALNQEMLIHFSNELRAPLPVIRDFIDLLSLEKAGPLNVKQKKILNLLHQNTEDLIEESANVIFYNQIKIGELYLNKKIVNLIELIKGVIQRNKNKLLTEKIDLVYRPRQKEIPIKTDRSKLQAAFNVFLKNIVLRIKDSTKIKITTDQSKYSPFIKVIITYQGEKLDLDEARTAQNLELYVASKIITLVGGNLNCHQDKDHSQQIIIILPSQLT